MLNLELLSEYDNARELIKVRCKICNNIFKTQYFNLHRDFGKCPICFPGNKSNGEIEISNFIKLLNLEITENSRDIIKPYELDIYIPFNKIIKKEILFNE